LARGAAHEIAAPVNRRELISAEALRGLAGSKRRPRGWERRGPPTAEDGETL